MMRSDIEALLKRPPSLIWHAGGEGVVLGTLGCVELNLNGHPFPGWSSTESRRAVADKLLPVLKALPQRRWDLCVEMKELSFEERHVLMERGQLTNTMAARQDGVYLLVNDAQDTECFINDEEHLVLQTFFPGENAVDHALAEMQPIFEALKEKLDVAHDSVFGYLSCDPAKSGETIFFSSLVHLPALRISKYMTKVQHALDEMSVYISPLFPCTGKKEWGDVYLIHSPAELPGHMDTSLRTMKATLDALSKQEMYARAKLLEDAKTAARLKADIAAAWQNIPSSLRYKQVLEALSLLRLGLDCKLIHTDTPAHEVSELVGDLLLSTGPAYQRFSQRIHTQRERRKCRADRLKALAQDQLHLSFNL